MGFLKMYRPQSPGFFLKNIVPEKERKKSQYKDNLIQEIEVDFKLSSDNNDQLLSEMEKSTSLNTILDRENQDLIIPSRIRWAEEGDKKFKTFL